MLQVLACAQPPNQGQLQLAGVNPWTLSSRALRRLRGQLFLAPQVPPLPPRQRVVTSVLAGRLPVIGLWASLRSLFYPADIPAAYAAQLVLMLIVQMRQTLRADLRCGQVKHQLSAA